MVETARLKRKLDVYRICSIPRTSKVAFFVKESFCLNRFSFYALLLLLIKLILLSYKIELILHKKLSDRFK